MDTIIAWLGPGWRLHIPKNVSFWELLFLVDMGLWFMYQVGRLEKK